MSNATYECTKSAIEQAINACEYVNMACVDDGMYFDFTSFYYCRLDQSMIMMIFISFIFVFYTFNFISKVADSYLAPSLQIISRKLKLSEAVAGATLLALGNSAPDVITGIVVGSKPAESIDIAIGGLFGGCLFTITIILAACIKGATVIHIDATALKRDILFLLLGLAYFLLLTILNQITPLLASGFFLIYFAYVVYIIIQQNLQNRRQKLRETPSHATTFYITESLLDPPGSDYDSNSEYGQGVGIDSAGMSPNFLQVNSASLLAPPKADDHGEVVSPYTPKVKSDPGENYYTKDQDQISKPDEQNVMSVKIKLKEEWNRGKKIRPSPRKESNRLFRIDSFIEEETEGKRIWTKITKLIRMPLTLLINLTIPSLEKENKNKYFLALVPYFSILFLIWQVEAIDLFIKYPYLWVPYGVIATSLTILICWKGRKINLAEKYQGLFAVLCFVMSTLWLNLITNLIVEYLALVEIISGLPLSFISLTILAWGTSLEDLFINVVLSKSGFGKMAVVGAYGSQVFSIFVGFGAAIFLQSLNNTIQIGLYQFNEGQIRSQLLTIMLLIGVICTLVITLLIAKKNRWKFSSQIMMFLCMAYLILFVIFTLISFV